MPEPLPPSRLIPLLLIIGCIGYMLTRPSPSTNLLLSITVLASFGTFIALEKINPVMLELVKRLAGRSPSVSDLEPECPEEEVEVASDFVRRVTDILEQFEIPEPDAPADHRKPVYQRRILSDAEVFAATRGAGFRAHPWSDQVYPSP